MKEGFEWSADRMQILLIAAPKGCCHRVLLWYCSYHNSHGSEFLLANNGSPEHS